MTGLSLDVRHDDRTHFKTGMTLAVKLLCALLVLAAIVVLGRNYLQRRLMYFPDSLRVRPAQVALTRVEEVEFPVPGAVAGLAWYGAAEPGKPTLLYFHGNAGSLETRAERVRKYTARGYGMFMMTYRGFGGRAGEPSEKANVEDALAAYDALVARGVEANRIVLYGESLGSGIAVQLAAKRPVAGIILDAPYTSMVDLAELHYRYLPSRWLLTDRYETTNYLSQVTAPVLIVHGEQDAIVPVAMGRRLYDLVRGPKEIRTFPRAGHSDHYLYGSYDAIYAWLDRLGAAGAPARAAGQGR